MLQYDVYYFTTFFEVGLSEACKLCRGLHRGLLIQLSVHMFQPMRSKSVHMLHAEVSNFDHVFYAEVIITTTCWRNLSVFIYVFQSEVINFDQLFRQRLPIFYHVFQAEVNDVFHVFHVEVINLRPLVSGGSDQS